MATTNTEFSVANLDFSTIKSNLITFMQGQDVFADYDFTGSNLNVFVEPSTNGSYTIVLGNGTFGRQPSNNNLLEISYRRSNGEEPNGANSFSADSIAGHSAAISLVTRATGGSGSQNLDDIRFSAPRALAVQERAVTKED